MADIQELLQAGLLDRYRIERELGRGGMATVYLAQDLRHARPVALKVLRPELAAALGPERFQREIRMAARLQHPHILTVHDSGETAGQLWYTMPFVEGVSLRERLNREKQLPIEDALRITREVAEALGYAHQHDIVHRDIKPENILMSQGHALVADFGLARATEAADNEKLTETGISLGTPAYMSPEQSTADPTIDGRSDLYSLGCVLYEMLTGETPYAGRSAQAIIAKRLSSPVPSARTLRETVPPTIDEALQRALAKSPADRFPTVEAFAEAVSRPPFNEPAPASMPVSAGSVAAPSVPPAPSSHRRLWAPAALAAIVLVGFGLLFIWRKSHPPADVGRTSPTRLAVLPFENLGRPQDEYFADGLTDAVRGKLTSLPGLQVTARSSSSQYKKTTKNPREIGRELGVDYLLTGTVRWQQRGSGQSRVQLSPELVQVSTAAAKWQAPFEAPLTDVFQVQADVAARVAEALGVALGAGERERLTERPTENLAAYDAFLRGEQAADGISTQDFAALRRAIEYYERAVALDSGFALAWVQLSRAHALDYWNAPTSPAAAAARHAAERALALAPERPDGHLAMGDYYGLVLYDPGRALEQYARGRQLVPNDARLVAGVAASEFALGHVQQALQHMREAEVLDPRSVRIAVGLAWALVNYRRYPEALVAAERALSLAPGNLSVIHATTMVYLARGDLAGARAALRAVPSEVDPAALVAFMATLDDLYWVLDDEQQRLLLRLSPNLFDNRAFWGLSLAETHALRGDPALARAYADSARLDFQVRLRDVPQDPQTHTFLGVALAYLGRRGEAVGEGQRGVALVSSHAMMRAYHQHTLARIYILVGEPDRALDLLERLLKMPYHLSPGWLKIDPTFDPLRGNPRFQRLVAGAP